MGNLRRRRRSIETVGQKLVRAGFAPLAGPTADPGVVAYAKGRKFYSAGDSPSGVANRLIYTMASPWKPTANRCTLACRVTSPVNDPGGEGYTLEAVTLGVGTVMRVRLNHNYGTWQFAHYGGTTATAMKALTYSANVPTIVIARMSAAGDDPDAKLDISANGASGAQVADSATGIVANSTTFNVGCHSNQLTIASLDVGPVLWSLDRKSQAWHDAIAVADWTDAATLGATYCNTVGDVIWPFGTDSIPYIRVGGGSPFDEAAADDTGSYVAFVGDSITFGTGVATTSNRYPNRVAATLSGWDWENLGEGGYSVTDALSEYGWKIHPRYGPLRDDNLLCLLVGTNDLIGASTPAQIYSNISTYIGYCKAQGWTVVVGTVPSNSDLTAGRETDRGTLNTAIIANAAGADAVADMTEDPHISAGNYVTQPDYWHNAAHPNDLGNGVIAGYFQTAIESLP
jgi:lysophospholipase L1-like esterase